MLPRLMVLTDRSQLRLGRGLVRTVSECVAAGLTHVVVRELDETEETRAALVAALVGVGATVISARTLLPGAVGVHLPAGRQAPGPRQASDLPDNGQISAIGAGGGLPAGRQALEEGGWGRSCHTPAEVGSAAAEGAAYAFLSPYAEGGSKPGRTPLPRVAYAGHAIPVYALGGVTPANAAAAREAGAHGVAVMGAVMAAPEPAAVVRELLEALG